MRHFSLNAKKSGFKKEKKSEKEKPANAPFKIRDYFIPLKSVRALPRKTSPLLPIKRQFKTLKLVPTISIGALK